MQSRPLLQPFTLPVELFTTLSRCAFVTAARAVIQMRRPSIQLPPLKRIKHVPAVALEPLL